MAATAEPDLSSIPTAELIRQAVDEAKLLARAEVLHAKQELKQELSAAKRAVILGTVALVCALMVVALLLVSLALALPLAPSIGALSVAAGLLLVGGGLAFAAYRSIPMAPMSRTQQRLKQDVRLARGEFA